MEVMPRIAQGLDRLGVERNGLGGHRLVIQDGLFAGGGAVDKRLGYATAHEAETMQKTRWAERAAMEGKPAATVVWRHMEQLIALRKREVEPALSSNIGMGW